MTLGQTSKHEHGVSQHLQLKTLLLSIVPAPLLQMTVAAFRRLVMSPVTHKRVVTFSFDRNMGLCAVPLVSTQDQALKRKSKRKHKVAVVKQKVSEPVNDGVVRVALPWCWTRDYGRRMTYMHADKLPDDVQPPDKRGWNPIPTASAFMFAGLSELTALYFRLLRAADEGWIVCTTPDSIKSLFLRYVDLLHTEREAAALAAVRVAKIHQRETCLCKLSMNRFHRLIICSS